MRSTLRLSAVCAFVVLAAVSTFGQQRPMIGTVVDVDSRGRLEIELDDEGYTRATIETDSVATQYVGFGTVIAGKPEIFTGSKGFSNVRLGDRIELRGAVRASGVYTADTIRLLGRQVAAGPVGVGQTRSQTNASTPTDNRTAAAQSGGTVEGTIRQINLDEGRLVIQTNQRRMITVRTYRNTPVYFRSETYRVSNLEIGDRVRIEADAADAQADEITAVRIDVTQSVRDSTAGSSSSASVVTVIAGRVARAEPGLDYAYVDDGRGEIRVDMSRARDERGDALHARDLRIGERVEISGSYNRAGDMFLASTVRPASIYMPDTDRPTSGTAVDVFDLLSVVSISGTVTEILEEDGTSITVRDRNNRSHQLWVTPDFVVRLRGSGYTTAANLRVDDGVTIKAFRDTRGNLIAQTIRLRNR